MRYESTELGQQLAALAENDELELPSASDYTAKDYAIAVEAYLTELHVNTVRALTNGEPGELRNMAKHLDRHCDMTRCDNLALPGDIFCKHHRAVEDSLVAEYDSAQAEGSLPF